MKQAAVIGANGFLGSKLTQVLLSMDIAVTAVHNANTSNIPPKATLITTADFLKSETIPDCIFFAVGNYACPHAELLEINDQLYQITLKFTESKIIYISSTNVY